VHIEANNKKVKLSRVAFVWYLTSYESQSIACAILIAARAIQDMHPRPTAEFVVVHTLGSVPMKPKFDKCNIRLIKVPEPSARGQHQWVSSFLKLRIAELFDYDRVVYFDVDTYPLGNMDYLFDLADFPVEIAAPRAYWLKQPFVQSGGPMVVDPRNNFFDKHFKGVLDGRGGRWGGYASEMDWVNEAFRDSIVMLPGFNALLVGEWCNTDGIYRYWQKYFDKSSSWVMEHASLVHFIAEWKPWKITNKAALNRKCPGAQLGLLAVFEKWWNAEAAFCNK